MADLEPTLQGVAEDFAAHVEGAFEEGWNVALADMKANFEAQFTKAKLFQYLAQFPFSLGTIVSVSIVDFLGSIRLGLQTIQGFAATAVVQTVLDFIPLPGGTKVCTQKAAIKGAIELFTDGIRFASGLTTPVEVAIGQRIRKSGKFLKLLKLIFGGLLQVAAQAKIVAALKLMLTSLVRTTLQLGGAAFMILIAFHMQAALRGRPNSYFKTLGQTKGRAFVTKKQYQRV